MAVLLVNKKINYDFSVIDTITCGIKLRGFEVKALKTRMGGSLNGSFVTTSNARLFIKNAMIPAYQKNNTDPGYDPYHTRELLVTKQQYQKIIKHLHEPGVTMIPKAVHSQNNRIVVECVIARGKKKHDKRQTIRKREDERAMRRTLKSKNR